MRFWEDPSLSDQELGTVEDDEGLYPRQEVEPGIVGPGVSGPTVVVDPRPPKDGT